MTTTVDLEITEKTLGRYPAESQHLVSILQDLQLAYRYLPREALEVVAEALDVPLAKVCGVATFYKSFSLTPRGEKLLRVCTGTACHIRGAPLILGELESRLKIRAGETSKDLKYSLEAVNCVGACALAPVVLVNDDAFGVLTVTKARRLVKDKDAQKGKAKKKAKKTAKKAPRRPAKKAPQKKAVKKAGKKVTKRPGKRKSS